MINNYRLCSLRYCLQSEMISILVLTILIIETEMISLTDQQDILPYRIKKTGPIKKIDNF